MCKFFSLLFLHKLWAVRLTGVDETENGVIFLLVQKRYYKISLYINRVSSSILGGGTRDVACHL